MDKVRASPETEEEAESEEDEDSDSGEGSDDGEGGEGAGEGEDGFEKIKSAKEKKKVPAQRWFSQIVPIGQASAYIGASFCRHICTCHVLF